MQNHKNLIPNELHFVCTLKVAIMHCPSSNSPKTLIWVISRWGLQMGIIGSRSAEMRLAKNYKYCSDKSRSSRKWQENLIIFRYSNCHKLNCKTIKIKEYFSLCCECSDNVENMCSTIFYFTAELNICKSNSFFILA